MDNSKQRLIRDIEEATTHLTTIPALLNMLIDRFHMDDANASAEMSDIGQILYLASSIIQDADSAISEAVGKAMKEEG